MYNVNVGELPGKVVFLLGKVVWSKKRPCAQKKYDRQAPKGMFLLGKVIFLLGKEMFLLGKVMFLLGKVIFSGQGYIFFWARSFGPKNDLVPSKNITFGRRRSYFCWAPTPPSKNMPSKNMTFGPQRTYFTGRPPRPVKIF